MGSRSSSAPPDDTPCAYAVRSGLGTIGITDPETGDPVRTGDIIPDVAVDRTGGALYLVWQDARFSGGRFDSIAFSQSLDDGRTWSTPIKVNLTPETEPAGDQQAFTPSVHVADDGTIAVTYYDFRSNTPALTTLETDYFLVYCHPTTFESLAYAVPVPHQRGSRSRRVSLTTVAIARLSPSR